MRHVLLFRDSMGRRVGSGKMRAAFRAGSFLLMVGLYGAAIYFRQGQYRDEEGFTEADETHRFLNRALAADSEDYECPERTSADPWFAVFAYIFGVLYMFLALAIICDEFFVPALEVIADQMELSMDIAGATLMAAGGSAPELFTSLVGTFEESQVGFSTIVGSAVFNVIFVIGECTGVGCQARCEESGHGTARTRPWPVFADDAPTWATVLIFWSVPHTALPVRSADNHDPAQVCVLSRHLGRWF